MSHLAANSVPRPRLFTCTPYLRTSLVLGRAAAFGCAYGCIEVSHAWSQGTHPTTFLSEVNVDSKRLTQAIPFSKPPR